MEQMGILTGLVAWSGLLLGIAFVVVVLCQLLRDVLGR